MLSKINDADITKLMGVELSLLFTGVVCIAYRGTS
jgi:hypothetical protein